MDYKEKRLILDRMSNEGQPLKRIEKPANLVRPPEGEYEPNSPRSLGSDSYKSARPVWILNEQGNWLKGNIKFGSMRGNFVTVIPDLGGHPIIVDYTKEDIFIAKKRKI